MQVSSPWSPFSAPLFYKVEVLRSPELSWSYTTASEWASLNLGHTPRHLECSGLIIVFVVDLRGGECWVLDVLFSFPDLGRKCWSHSQSSHRPHLEEPELLGHWWRCESHLEKFSGRGTWPFISNCLCYWKLYLVHVISLGYQFKCENLCLTWGFWDLKVKLPLHLVMKHVSQRTEY